MAGPVRARSVSRPNPAAAKPAAGAVQLRGTPIPPDARQQLLAGTAIVASLRRRPPRTRTGERSQFRPSGALSVIKNWMGFAPGAGVDRRRPSGFVLLKALARSRRTRLPQSPLPVQNFQVIAPALLRHSFLLRRTSTGFVSRPGTPLVLRYLRYPDRAGSWRRASINFEFSGGYELGRNRAPPSFVFMLRGTAAPPIISWVPIRTASSATDRPTTRCSPATKVSCSAALIVHTGRAPPPLARCRWSFGRSWRRPTAAPGRSGGTGRIRA